MRQSHPFLLLALLAIVTSVSCRFISGLSPEASPEPPINNNDDRSLKFVPENLPDAQQGVAYEVRINIENVETFVGEVKVSQAELPPGLVLERVEGENAAKIVGIPQETGTFSFKLEVQCLGTNDPGQVGEKEYTIIVKAIP
jgi:hypothetical protein